MSASEVEEDSDSTASRSDGVASGLKAFQSNRYVRLAELVLFVVAVVGLVWTFIRLTTSQDNYQLQLWIRGETPLYPSDSTDGQPLPLSYGGRQARSVTVVEASIANRGTEPIGSQRETWELTITAPDAKQLVVGGSPQRSSQRMVVDIVDSRSENKVQLQLGLFAPEDELTMLLMVIEPDNPKFPTLTTASTLRGLSPPQVTTEGPSGQYAQRLFPFLWALGGLVLAGAVVSETRRNSDLSDRFANKPVKYALGRMAFIALLSLTTAYMVASGLGWLIVNVDRFA